MALSKKEKEQLDALTAKSKEPEAPSVGRSAVFKIDLGDPDQVSMAARLGLISVDDDEDDGTGGDDDEGGKDDDAPARRGYFKES